MTFIEAVQERVIDVHVHLAGLPHGGNGCYISPKMLKGPLFRFVGWRLGLPLDNPERANQVYVERLLGYLKASTRVKKAVLLGMDGVYEKGGGLDEGRTEFLVSNDYVLQTAASHADHFLPGVSINPYRRDAVEEVARCAERGAFLVKVLPNSQQFDPADPACLPFYKALAKHRLPLLSHVGYEFSLWGKDQSAGDPARLRSALEEGVTIIAAHGASFGLFLYEKYWGTLAELVTRYPHFYWDASALSLQNRVGMLLRIRRHPELWDRMIFGTDYPLPVYAYPALLAGHPVDYVRLLGTRNPFDRQSRLLSMMGLPPGKVKW